MNETLSRPPRTGHVAPGRRRRRKERTGREVRGPHRAASDGAEAEGGQARLLDLGDSLGTARDEMAALARGSIAPGLTTRRAASRTSVSGASCGSKSAVRLTMGHACRRL